MAAIGSRDASGQGLLTLMREHLRALSLPMQRQLEAAALLELVLQVSRTGCRGGARFTQRLPTAAGGRNLSMCQPLDR